MIQNILILLDRKEKCSSNDTRHSYLARQIYNNECQEMGNPRIEKHFFKRCFKIKTVRALWLWTKYILFFSSSLFCLVNYLRLSKILLPDIVCRSSLPPCWCRSRARWCRPRRSSRPPSPSPPSSGTPRLARLSPARQQLHAARACTGAGAEERVSYLSW